VSGTFLFYTTGKYILSDQHKCNHGSRYDAPATAPDGPSPGRAKDGMTSVGTGLVSKKPRTAIFRPPKARRKPGFLISILHFIALSPWRMTNKERPRCPPRGKVPARDQSFKDLDKEMIVMYLKRATLSPAIKNSGVEKG
jgi:hypothetical protein